MSEYVSFTGTTTAGNTTFSPNTTGGYYYTWGDQWVGGWDNSAYQPVTVIKEIIKEREVKLVEERSLWRIYVVDPRKGGAILMNGNVVVAKNENEALLKAGVAQVVSDIGRELDQVDVYAEKIGTFIRPRKEAQRVKISKEDED